MNDGAMPLIEYGDERMVFSSLFFLYVFLPLCLLIYSTSKNMHSKNTVLIIFSLIFYAWGEPVFIWLFILEAVINFILSKTIEKHKGGKGAKAAVILAIVTDLGMLGVFKYSGFIAENLNTFLPVTLPVPDVKLPIGISFYTFQMVSYVIDCYWEKITPLKRFSHFFMYVSFFPQLVAGPIVRYSTIEGEIANRSTTAVDVWHGIIRVAVGLTKKAVLANSLSIITNSFFGGDVSELSILGTWYAAAVYAMQVYFDFSGYSDMAIGMGRIFGFHFDENFKDPFICKDITEFWQRWHISLGSFFRDYLLYVPIFGKRRKYGGLFLVWFCTGLWHGAAWNYIIWGLYFGSFILFEQLLGKKTIREIPTWIRHCYNKPVLIIGFGIFYFEDIGKLGDFFKNLVGFNGNSIIDDFTTLSVSNNIYLLLIAIICCLPVGKILADISEKGRGGLKYLVSLSAIPVVIGLFMLSTVMLTDATNNPFLYFRF